MKQSMSLLLAYLLVFTLGCSSPPKTKVTVVPEPTVRPAPLFSVKILNNKIAFLETILKKNRLPDKDKKIASELLNTYRLMKSLSPSHLTEKEYRRLTRSLFRTMAQMDERYFAGEIPSKKHSGDLRPFLEKREEILDLYTAGSFKGVVNDCFKLKADYGQDALTPEIGLVFALSLAKEGMLEEAIDIGKTIAMQLEETPDLFYLRATIARWQLRLGRKDQALHIYERLTDSQDETLALINNLRLQITDSEGHAADERVPPSPPSLKDESVQEGDVAKDMIKEVDSLIKRHAYKDARLLLLRYGIKAEEESERDIIDSQLERVKRAEEEFEKRPGVVKEVYVKETIGAAREYIEEEQYEEAISKIDELRKGEDVSGESRALKERAIESIINKERNRAAEMFLAAKRSKDPSKKEALLSSSYKILKSIIDKYPSSPLNPKLKSHLSIVKKEMDKLRRDRP